MARDVRTRAAMRVQQELHEWAVGVEGLPLSIMERQHIAEQKAKVLTCSWKRILWLVMAEIEAERIEYVQGWLPISKPKSRDIAQEDSGNASRKTSEEPADSEEHLESDEQVPGHWERCILRQAGVLGVRAAVSPKSRRYLLRRPKCLQTWGHESWSRWKESELLDNLPGLRDALEANPVGNDRRHTRRQKRKKT